MSAKRNNKLPRWLKILLKSFMWLFFGFVLLFTTVCIILVVKEKDIYQYAIKELNSNQVGETVIGDISISPFKAFPYISIDLKEVSFYPDKEFHDDDPIYHFDDVYLGFSLWDILKGEFNIKKILLSNGFIHLERYEDGNLNLLLAKASIEEEEKIEQETGVHLALKNIELKNVTIEERACHTGDKYINFYLDDVVSRFSYIGDKIDVFLDGEMVLNEFTSNGVTLFSGKHFEIHTELLYDTATGIAQLMPGNVIVENGDFHFEGKIDVLDDVNLNISIYGQKKNFDMFFAFAPSEIFENINKFKNEGDIYFKGKITGPTLHSDPAIDVELGCENTMFFHHQTQKAIKDLQFVGRFHTGEMNSLETAEFTLTNLYGVPERGLFKGTLRVVNFIEPRFSVDFHSNIDLSNLETFYDFDWLESSSGQLIIDITINEFVDSDSAIHMATKLKEGTNSQIVFKNASFKFRDYPHAIKDINGKIEIDGDDVVLKELHAKIADSDIHFDSKITNVAALMHHYNAPMDFFFHGYSKKINLVKLMPKEAKAEMGEFSNEEITGLDFDFDIHTTSKALEKYEVFPKATLFFRKLNFKLKGYPHTLSEFSGKINSSDDLLELEQLTVRVGKNDITCSTAIKNPKALTNPKAKERVDFTAYIKSGYFDLMELLVYNGKSLVSEEINKEFDKEIIRDLYFVGQGNFTSNSFYPHGFYSRFNIDKFNITLNDLPPVRNAKGVIKTDTSGCIYINHLHAQMGKSDFDLDLEMKHYLNPEIEKKEIVGKIGGKTWDFDDLMGYIPSAPNEAINHDEAFNLFALPFPDLKLKANVGAIKSHKYFIKNLDGSFKTTPNHYLYMDKLDFDAADGHIKMDGYFNGADKNEIYLSSTLIAKGVDLDKFMYKFDNFGQEYLLNENLHGIVDATVKSKVHVYPDLAVDLKKSDAHIEVKVKEGRLVNFSALHAMGEFMGDKDLDNIRFAEMENTMDLKNGTLTIPKMKIASTLGYIYLSGTQELEDKMKMKYEVQVPLSLIKEASWNYMKSKVSKGKNKSEVDIDKVQDEIIADQKGLVKKYVTVTILGDVDDYTFKMGKIKER
ncbi:MAG: AsmA-like C-terminal region-containing protein [Flavobacteriales bacterium]